MRNLVYLFLTTLFFQFSYAQQPWKRNLPANPTLQQVKDAHSQYWNNRPYQRGKGWKQYKRWEYFWGKRLKPNQTFPDQAQIYSEIQQFRNQQQMSPLSTSGAWTPLGPTLANGGGAGRVNCIAFHPTNSNTIFVGTPAGGLWRSYDGGATWASNTDQLSVLGVSSIAFDPNNANNVWIVTGDGDAGDTYSVGLLKSTDGGLTWNTTSLSYNVTAGVTLRRVVINPTNSNIIMVCGSDGLYRSTNGGTSFTQVLTGTVFDIEFKPNDPNTVYISRYSTSSRIMKSTDGGATFAAFTTGFTFTNTYRIELAVTPANANYVYALSSDINDDSFDGFYRSTNGTSWTAMSTSPNYLGYEFDASDGGGQGSYDLAIAASPTNADVVFIGGVNIWKTTNGGTSFSLSAHWTGTNADYVHADIHDLKFLPGSGTTLFSANDGGFFKSTDTGTNWTDLSNGLYIMQLYRFSNSATNSNLILAGAQDNGTNLKTGASITGWDNVYGGDGMEAIIDYSNSNIQYCTIYYGDIYKSTDGGASFPTQINTGITQTGDWVTPYIIHPTTNTTLYAGYDDVWRTTNGGTSWTKLSNFTSGEKITALAIAPSNTSVLYASSDNHIYKTTNGGTNWTEITTGLPVSSASISNIGVSNTDPNVVFVTFSGYSSGNKVYKSTNGGTAWTNYSTGLPNLPVNCVVYENGTSDRVYIGTDVGVYYRETSLTSWAAFSTGLPNVVVNELEIHYGTQRLRAATFGRGVWESDLYTTGTSCPAPTASGKTICPGSTATLTASGGTSYAWYSVATGGTKLASTATYTTPTLSSTTTYYVENIVGTCTSSRTAVVVTVLATQALPYTQDFEGTFVPTGWQNLNPDTLGWEKATNVLNNVGALTSTAKIRMYDYAALGQKDSLIMPLFSFTGQTGIKLSFDLSYARYDATGTYDDSLRVLISTNCGTSWTQLYNKWGATLAPSTILQTASFAPTGSAQWRRDTIDLSAYNNQASVLIAFVTHNRYGQNLYLDNINLTNSCNISAPSASGTSICSGNTVSLIASGGTSYAWYSVASGGTKLASTAAYTTPSLTTTTTYYVENISAGCTSARTAVTVTVNSASAPTASGTTICSGSTATLTASGGTSYAWYSVATGGTKLASTAAYTTPTLTSTTTYYVENIASGCTSTRIAVTVTVQSTINLPYTQDFEGTFVPAGWQNLNPDTLGWEQATGINSAVTGTTKTALIRLFDYNAPGQKDTLKMPAFSFSSVTNAKMTFDVSYARYDATGTYNDTLRVLVSTNCGATWTQVYLKSAMTNLPTAPDITTSFAPTGSTQWRKDTIDLAAYNGQASVILAFAVNNRYGQNLYLDNINLNSACNLSAPTSSGTSICSGNTASLTASGGTSYAWYSVATGGTKLASTASYTTPTLTSTTTYYVENISAGCTSARTAVTVTVNTANAPTASDVNICSGTTASLTASGGTSYAWYAVATGGTKLASTASYTTPTLTTSTTYFVENIVSGCTSARSAVTVTVNTTNAPTASDVNICSGTTASLTASGGTSYAWYAVATGGTKLASTASYTTPTLTTSTTYFVENIVSGCTSSRTAVTVTVNTTNAPTASDANICSGTTASLTASGGTSYAWYSVATGGTKLASTAAYTTPTLTTTTTYFVENIVSGCTSARTAVTVTVNTANAPTASDANICSGTTASLTASGGTSYAWYSIATGGTPISTSAIFVTPNLTTSTTYFVENIVSGCTSARSAITVNVNAVNASFSANGNLLTASPAGATYQWLLNGTSISGATSETYTITQSGQYSVVVSQNGCSDTTASQTITFTTLDLNQKENILVYPNPVEDEFHIVLNNNDHYTYQILNMNGQVVKNGICETKESVISIQNLTKGHYILRLISGQKIQEFKLTKN